MSTDLYLTFDDGPDAAGTARLLDLLAKLGARATFFVIGKRAEIHAELIAKTIDAGHTVGLHCDEHDRHSERTEDWVREDTSQSLGRLERLGVRPHLWRTPWGDKMPWSQTIADEFDLRLVDWTADTHDWRGDSSEQMLRHTRDELVADAIVLAHDGIGPGAQRTDIEETLGYVELASREATRRGLCLEALT